jgi:predicted dehydrogenase
MPHPEEPLRVGVLGAARIAGLAIVAPAAATGHRLVAVAARDRRRAEAFAREHAVERVVDSYADLIADPEVDVVYNPLPNGLHGPWNSRALQAGNHVLSEKPSASNAEEATAVGEAVRKAGTTFMEAFHYLFHPVTRRLLAIAESGELGRIEHVATMVAIPAPPDTDPRWSLPLAGGAMMDLGCYSLHAQRMVGRFAGGPPALASARACRPDRRAPTEPHHVSTRRPACFEECAGGVGHEGAVLADVGVESFERRPIPVDGEVGHPPHALAQDVDDGTDVEELHPAACGAQVDDPQSR